LHHSENECNELRQQKEQLETELKRLQSDVEVQQKQLTQQIQQLKDDLAQQKKLTEELQTNLLEKEERLASALNILERKLKEEETYKVELQALRSTLQTRDTEINTLNTQLTTSTLIMLENV
jgi:chromosome segregation ATPase